VKLLVNPRSLSVEDIFEFYWSPEARSIPKACFRISSEEISTDIILVISSNATIITLYTTNKNDTHRSMDKNLYTTRKKG
jgi:hypothetical protein